MTAQIADTIRLAGRKLELYSLPLDDWFEQTGTEPGFESPHTALWRGYIATWEITDDRLYLVARTARSHIFYPQALAAPSSNGRRCGDHHRGRIFNVH